MRLQEPTVVLRCTFWLPPIFLTFLRHLWRVWGDSDTKPCPGNEGEKYNRLDSFYSMRKVKPRVIFALFVLFIVCFIF